jgi:hypothetical protein
VKLDLVRLSKLKNTTFGVMLVEGKPLCVTLEPGAGVPTHPAIPDGTYRCEIYMSPKFGRSLQIMDVPNRTYILIHAGNTSEDTQGCVVLGSSYARAVEGVSSSRVALSEFMALVDKAVTKKENILITVRSC